MSTYTNRYIEVRREKIDGAVWSYDDLPQPSARIGQVYKINMYQLPEGVARYYRAVTGGDAVAWVPLEKVETEWVPVKWFSYLPKNSVMDNKDPYYKPEYHIATNRNDGGEFFIQEHMLWYDNGGVIRDEYVSDRGWEAGPFIGRGLPEDISEDVRKDIEATGYAYSKTWVTLEEWENALDEAEKDFMHKVRERFTNEGLDEVAKKLDEVLSLLKPGYKKPRKKRGEEDYEDSIDYIFEEWLSKLYQISHEIERIEFIVNEFYPGYCKSGRDVRVIYYLG